MIFDSKWRIEDRKEDRVITFPRFLAVMLVLAVAATLMIVYAPKSHARVSKGSVASHRQEPSRMALLNVK